MNLYVATSAAAKLLVDEAESDALATWMDAAKEARIMSSLLLETDLRRLATRAKVPQSAVSDLLARFDMIELDATTFRAAGLLPGPDLRSLDALHVAAALQADCSAMVTYDERQASAAAASGLPVERPVP